MDASHQEPWHWHCCWMPICGKVLWSLSFLALVGGLAALWQGGVFLGVAVMTWYWNALVGGVLALGAKAAAHHCDCQPAGR